jgi:RNA polymerase-binding transcription factor
MNTQNLPIDKHLLLQFKRGLQEQQRELSHAIEKAENEIRDFTGPVPLDTIDLSCFTASKESLITSASQNRTRLHMIEQALERMTDGSFGVCVDCGAAIRLKRLQALPWASHCIECQEQAETASLARNAALTLPPSAFQASGT